VLIFTVKLQQAGLFCLYIHWTYQVVNVVMYACVCRNCRWCTVCTVCVYIASSISQSDSRAVYLAMFLSTVGLVIVVTVVVFVLRRHRACLRLRGIGALAALPPTSPQNAPHKRSRQLIYQLQITSSCGKTDDVHLTESHKAKWVGSCSQKAKRLIDEKYCCLTLTVIELDIIFVG